MMKHQLKLYNQVVSFEVLPGNSPIGGSLERILSFYIWQDIISVSIQRGESEHTVDLRSNPLYIMTWMHSTLKILFLLFGVAFNFLFGCRFPLIKGTEKTGTCMKTYGSSCLMRRFVIGWCSYVRPRTTWSRTWWLTSMATTCIIQQ